MLQEHIPALICVALLGARLLLGARRFHRYELRSWLTTVAVLAVVTEGIAAPYVVPTGSMRPTIVDGDHVLATKIDITLVGPRLGEIVVVRSPESNIMLCKRIVGMGGDRLAVHDGHLWRNGQELEEPYIREPMQGEMAEQLVPPNTVFLMGDNRNNSHDSRAYGPVPVSLVKGRVASLLRWL